MSCCPDMNSVPVGYTTGRNHLVKKIVRLVALAVFEFAFFQAASAAEDVISKHLELARELVATVKAENNTYEVFGPGRGVRWKGDFLTSENSVNASCVVFITAVLDRAKSPVSTSVASNTRWQRELRVNNYFESVQKGYGLKQVGSLVDAEPGDLFLFSCKDMCANSKSTDIQGHITFIDVKPTLKNPTPPLIEATQQWLVTVIDSADAPHDRNDTRWRPQGERKASGVGRGTYRVYTDMNGVPVGYTNGPNGPKFHDGKDRPIVIGRPLPY